MNASEYLLDANIVIKIWQSYPKLFEVIEAVEGIDFKVTKDIAGELSRKEFRNVNGVPVLTNKFLKLLDHIIEDKIFTLEEITNSNIVMKQDFYKGIYFINENKLSRNDFTLICICKKYEKYKLVTEDKRILDSARLILDPLRVLNFRDFIYELKNLSILKEL